MGKVWPLPERFRVRLIFESDWHVGSGTGRRGSFDRLVIRDGDDLPYVPAKTLHGVWRDACERLCRALDDGQVGSWSRLVDQIFGSQPGLGGNNPSGRHQDPARAPIPSAIQIRPARIPEPLRSKLLQSDRRFRQVLTFIKPGVKIDPRSGASQTDFLRFEEVARRGTVLEAECQLRVPSNSAREVASALLVASAMLVERLGGKRRRGAGRCRLEIVDADVAAAIKWLKQNSLAPEWPEAEQETTSVASKVVSASYDGPWVCVPLKLMLEEPLAVSFRTVGNIVESLDFIPGTYLLPHVTRAFKSLGVDVRQAIQSGDLILLPAYPEVDGERGMPVPICLFARKGVSQPLSKENRQSIVNVLIQREPNDGTQRKQLREGYISTQQEHIYKTPMILRTHNTVEDGVQRPTRDTGGVYSYEAVSPTDQGKAVVFRTELRLRQTLVNSLAKVEEKWWTKLNGDVALGRSKKDDYGLARLIAASPEPWTAAPAPRADGLLFVWLVSDALVTNERLRPEPTSQALAKELGRRLGVKLRLRESSNGCLNELIRVRRLDTWHVGWGLPRPTLIALQAGSCMVFQVEGQLDPDKLAEVEARGIGLRTAEGFGQVRFNHPLLTTLPTQWSQAPRESVKSEPPNLPQGGPMDEQTQEFARLLEIELWKQEIRRACMRIAADAGKREELLGWDVKKGMPPMSQLGALRSQLALLQSPGDKQQIIRWLEHLARNNRRREKWPSLEKVKGFIELDDRIWEQIPTEDRPTLTPDAEKLLKQELWPFAVRTFFDACIRAHKRELEGAQSEESVHGT